MRMMHLNLFIFGCGHHRAAWRHPLSAIEQLNDVRYYEKLAQNAERGKFDAVFFADWHAIDNVADGPRSYFDPLTLLAALARATDKIGLISTVSSTFTTPFHAARTLASLDHLSKGRIGWNVVTSMFDSEARNHGYEAMPPHEWRYARAAEFIDAVQELWDSWEPDAVINDRQGNYVDKSKVRAVNYRGEHFTTQGPLTIPRPPQGHPVLFQAGASEQGRALAAAKAEGIYAVAYDLEAAQDYYRDMKRRMRAIGRDVALPIMPGLVTYVASTEAEAKAKQCELDELLPVATSLRQLESFISQDCSAWQLDAPVPVLPPLEQFTGPKGRYATILRIIESEHPTLRQLLGRLAAGGGHCTMVGTPEMLADRMENWWRNEGADGFNLMPPSLPADLDDFVEQVVPVLQKRGIFRTDYTTATLRGHLS